MKLLVMILVKINKFIAVINDLPKKLVNQFRYSNKFHIITAANNFRNIIITLILYITVVCGIACIKVE